MWAASAWLSMLLLVTAAADLSQSPASSPIANFASSPFNQLLSGNQLLITRTGDNVTLPCRMFGNPQPTIAWYRSWPIESSVRSLVPEASMQRLAVLPPEMLLVTTDDRSAISRYQMETITGALSIMHVEAADVGLFQCVATNRFGSTVSNVFQISLIENQPFEQRKATSLEANIGDSVVLSCRFPRAAPSPARFWSVFDESNPSLTRTITIDATTRKSRFAIDYEGNLYITNLLAEDYNIGEQRYVSNQYQKDVRSSYHGCDHIIRPSTSSRRSAASGSSRVYSGPSIKLLYSSADTITVEENSTARMKCIFGGNPTPIVEWYRLLPDGSSRRVVEGQELVLANASEQDAGEYFCMARNAVALRHTFRLDVVQSPRFTEPLKLTVVNEFESAELQCEAVGRPLPIDIRWFVNGEPVTVDTVSEQFRLLSSTRLHFLNVSRTSMATVLCNVSNDAGYMVSEAPVVSSDRPPILSARLADVSLVTGSVITLRCDSITPVSTVVWTKDGRNLVVDDRSQRLAFDRTSQALTLKNVTKADSGVYKCALSNRYGQTDSAARVTVKQRTTVAVAPAVLRRRENEEARFVCTFQTDPTERGVQAEWFVGDHKLAEDARHTMQHENFKTTLLVSQTTLSDTDTYRCVVNTSVDVGVAAARLVVQAPPNAPTHLVLTCAAEKKEARLSWQSGGQNNAEITHYSVEYGLATGFWRSMQSVMAETSDSQSTLLRLAPWMNYRFRMTAENSVGVSPPSEETDDSCVTQPEKPLKNPTGVSVHGVSEGTVTVSWSPLQRTEIGGPGFVYRVRLQCDPDVDTWIEVNVTDFERDEVTIGETASFRVPVYRRCKASVLSSNEIGDCDSNPLVFEGHSGEAVPLVVPQAIEVVTSRDDPPNSVSIFIHPPINTSADAIRGCWSGYQIGWWHSRAVPNSFERVLNVSFESCREALNAALQRQPVTAVLTNVPGLSSISVVAAVTTRYHRGPWSLGTVINTPEGVPSKCEEFASEKLGATYVRLRWAMPTSPNGHILGYKLAYQVLDGSGRSNSPIQLANTINDPLMWGGSLFGLVPNTSYKIFLSAFTARGTGESTETQITTLDLPLTSLTKPTFDVVFYNETVANVTLTMSVRVDFYVQYRTIGRLVWQSTVVEYGRKWKLVTGLNRFLQYEFRVVTISSQTHTDVSSEVIMISYEKAAPASFNFSSVAWLGAMVSLIVVLVIILTVICCRRKKVLRRTKSEEFQVSNDNRIAGNSVLNNTVVFSDNQLNRTPSESDDRNHSVPNPLVYAPNRANIVVNNDGTISYAKFGTYNPVRDAYSPSSYDTNSSGLCNSLRPMNHQVVQKQPYDTLRSATVSFSKLSSIECDV